MGRANDVVAQKDFGGIKEMRELECLWVDEGDTQYWEKREVDHRIVKFNPMAKEKKGVVKQRVKELLMICETLEEGLESMEREWQRCFIRSCANRNEGLDCLGRMHVPKYFVIEILAF